MGREFEAEKKNDHQLVSLSQQRFFIHEIKIKS